MSPSGGGIDRHLSYPGLENTVAHVLDDDGPKPVHFVFKTTLKLTHIVGGPIIPAAPEAPVPAPLPDHPALHVPCWAYAEPVRLACLKCVAEEHLSISLDQLVMTGHYAWGLYTTVNIEVHVSLLNPKPQPKPNPQPKPKPKPKHTYTMY